jgi:hypothetical protein
VGVRGDRRRPLRPTIGDTASDRPRIALPRRTRWRDACPSGVLVAEDVHLQLTVAVNDSRLEHRPPADLAYAQALIDLHRLFQREGLHFSVDSARSGEGNDLHQLGA